MGPVLLDNTQPYIAQLVLQKLNELSYKVLPHLSYSPDLLPTDYYFFKHLDNFLQGECFHNQQEAENAFPEFVESQSTDSHWQKCLIVMVPILSNKDIFESSLMI